MCNYKFTIYLLLGCKNYANVWNRDCNEVTNIYKIEYNSIHNVKIHQTY